MCLLSYSGLYAKGKYVPLCINVMSLPLELSASSKNRVSLFAE